MFSVKNLDVAYGQSKVIHDISFDAAPKETIAVMGRNGMGKTTLMKSLIGILQPRNGSVSVSDKNVTGMESYERVRNGIAYVPQGRHIFSTLTVEENIQTGLEASGGKTIKDEIYTLFPVLKEMRRRKGGNLSGGQQQQLAIARALVSEPKVLLLDEPTEGIQPSIIKEIAGLLNEIKRLRDITIIVSEQVLSFTMAIADRIFVIESGRIVHQDSRANVNEAQVAKYLAV